VSGIGGRANITKRYLVHVAGFNLSVVLRKLLGFGTPRGFASAPEGLFAAILVLWATIRAVSVALLCQPHIRSSPAAMLNGDSHQIGWRNQALFESVRSTGLYVRFWVMCGEEPALVDRNGLGLEDRLAA
jgi:hypothetical protein